MRRLLHVTTTDMSLELLLGPQLRAFQSAGFEVHTASAPGPYVSALEADGIVHHPLRHATRATAPHRDLLALLELYRLFRRVRPDIVHTHNPKPGVYGRIAARAARVPLVVNTQHGLYAQPTDRWARKLPVYVLERIAAAFSHVELVQNEEDLATLRRLRVPDRKLRLLGNGVDLERFAPRPEVRREVREELGIPDEAIVVGAVGRLVWEKGYAELFEAAKAILAERSDVVFVVAGGFDPDKGDPLTADDIAEAEDAGVRFLGHRNDPERLYQAFDVYVLASHREGFPRSAMEAMACGVPVVACDIRGCRQVVDDGVTGLLVTERNPRSLQATLEDLLDDVDRRRHMADAALVRARRLFDQHAVIDRSLAAYSGLENHRTRRDAPIVHVLPSDLRRGAQTYASDLLRALPNGTGAREHLALTLFSSSHVRLSGDSLALPGGALRRLGLDPRVPRRLQAYLRDVDAALVVAHGGESLKYAAMTGFRPVVYLKIGGATKTARRGLRWRWHRRLVQWADAVVGVSSAMAEEAQTVFGAAPDRVRVIPNGRDPGVYRPADKVDAPTVPRMLFVGHMTPTKRPELFIEIVEALRRRDLLFASSMVGDGPALEGLRARAEAADIHVLGGRDDVSRLLAGADLFVFTSVPEGEGMPGVLVEAALAGLPIVTTSVPGADDVVLDGISGSIRPPDDVDGMVDACEQLLRTPALRHEQGTAGRRHALAHLTMAAGVQRWEELFTEILGEGPPSSPCDPGEPGAGGPRSGSL